MSETTTAEATTALQPREARAVAVVQGESAATSMMNFISFAVRDPSVDVTKLDALLRMQREVAADDAKAQFFRALHAGQQEMPRVKKNGCIDLGKDKDDKARGSIPFATLEDVDAICRPIWAGHGFSVTFSSPEKSEQGIKWEATWRHVAGHAESNSMTLPADSGPGRNALQAQGSTNKYARRYLIEDFWNIVREGVDDDGKRGGTVYIREDTLASLKKALAGRKITEAEFARSMGVQSLEEIEEKDVNAAKTTLKNWVSAP